MHQRKGFIATLFDLSFTELITTRIIRFLYALSIVISALATFGFVAGGFGQSSGAGVAALIFSPVAFLLLVTISRIGYEMIIVVFRIAEYARDMAGR